MWEQVTHAEVGGRSRRYAFPLEMNFIETVYASYLKIQCLMISYFTENFIFHR